MIEDKHLADLRDAIHSLETGYLDLLGAEATEDRERATVVLLKMVGAARLILAAAAGIDKKMYE